MAINGVKYAVYRAEDGQLHSLSPICPHMHCDVAWNDAERSWDCPCHGSRFTPTGEVLNGPGGDEHGAAATARDEPRTLVADGSVRPSPRATCDAVAAVPRRCAASRSRNSTPIMIDINEHLPALRPVIFDIDGTLVDSNDAHAHAWVDSLAEAGHHVAFDRVRPLIGMGGDKVLPELVGIEDDSPEGKRLAETPRRDLPRALLPARAGVAGRTGTGRRTSPARDTRSPWPAPPGRRSSKGCCAAPASSASSSCGRRRATRSVEARPRRHPGGARETGVCRVRGGHGRRYAVRHRGRAARRASRRSRFAAEGGGTRISVGPSRSTTVRRICGGSTSARRCSGIHVPRPKTEVYGSTMPVSDGATHRDRWIASGIDRSPCACSLPSALSSVSLHRPQLHALSIAQPAPRGRRPPPAARGACES